MRGNPEVRRNGFVWDSEKDEYNQRHHGVSFSEALTVFDDPNVFDATDDYHSWDEPRFRIIGYTRAGVLLKVIYTEQGPDTRLISAFVPGNSERKDYGRFY